MWYRIMQITKLSDEKQDNMHFLLKYISALLPGPFFKESISQIVNRSKENVTRLKHESIEMCMYVSVDFLRFSSSLNAGIVFS